MNEQIFFGSFGEILKGTRRRKKITQKQLARLLGVHHNTISIWEQGSYLPGSQGMVLELARHLTLNDRETRLLLEASLTALSPYWHVPFPRNPFFTGREEILESLHEQLGSDQTVVLSQSSALCGLGGIGKTQVALEYAYRYALEYSAVFWIGAETDESLLSSFQRIAEVLQLPERDDTDQQGMAAAVQRWLSTHRQWLLIWDNVEDLSMLDRFLPSTRSGTLLITTRHQALGTLARGMDLLPMGQEEGIYFLLRRAKVLAPETTMEQMRQFAEQMPEQYAAAEALVTAMGCLPLALDQAGAYIEETGCSVVTYQQRYEQQRASMLERRGLAGAGHPHSVTTTFQLALKQIEQESGDAATLLHLCVFLYADAIPEELFAASAVDLGPVLGPLTTDPARFDQAIAVLRRLSLIQRQKETGTLSIHRLVQAVLWEEMSTQQQAVWQQHTISLLNAAFPEVTHSVWKQGERLLSHVLACAASIPEDVYNLDLANVLRKTADYLRERARFDEPEALYLRAIHIVEQVEGQHHPRLAPSLYGLGLLYLDQGKYPQAEQLCQHAILIWEHFLGQEHIDLARPLTALGNIFLTLGKYPQAEPLYLRTLYIREKALGQEHHLLIAPLTNLAEIYREQGKYVQAESFYLRAIHIHEQSSAAPRPMIAYPLHGLGCLYARQGKYELAKPLFQRALAVRELELGPQHPYVAEPLTGLTLIAFHRGKYDQAEAGYQKAVQICEQGFGPDHPDVATPLTYLADLYTEQGKYEQAESLYRRALRIREQASDVEHPQMMVILNGLATLSLKLGRGQDAEACYRRAIRIGELHMGQHHPEIAQMLHDLALCLQQQGRLSEALLLAERALAILSQHLEDAHPQTVATDALVTLLLEQQGCVKETIDEEDVNYRAKDAIDYTEEQTLTLSDPFQEFLQECCDLHMHAWCRSSDLWDSYEHWAEKHDQHYILSQRRFFEALKAQGCQPARTNKSRIWKGIALKAVLVKRA